MEELTGKNILVTGATSGIGQAIAARLVAEGSNVALNYRNDINKLDDTKKMIEKMTSKMDNKGGQYLPVEGDVSEEKDILRMYDEVIKKWGSLDILVNNAGIQIYDPSEQVETDDFDKVINVNLRGAYLCAREAIQHFLNTEKKGIILNVSSVHEIIPRPQYVSYAISKGGIKSMTQTLALEYAPYGIRVNAIAPGATDTSINDDWLDDPQKKQAMKRRIPLGRVGTPEEMAAAAAFLMSDEAQYITGQTLFIDGGMTLYPNFLNS
ncbi:putative glucose 1-dehydrogenase [Crocosphaera subtropica ATCC 51142]|uniref:Glucose 1-dehydrogenase n=1 Tax=Crocosphaera subtropica (strain ATCC 51142 / BH68) TaxID=43989 RepID=B1X072_CROS5|nr:glucose 1-dehydrogenase [Crocosphaera subtropica]ACB49573.1 putative glucose 1-dehydrogenase [Crocosphaera subtropica ATCC 51142]